MIAAKRLNVVEMADLFDDVMQSLLAYPPQPRQIRRQPRDWFDVAVLLVPKSIREPWAGDLLEDRANMAAGGESRALIEWATTMQLLALVVTWIKELVLDFISLGHR